mmetsp:Transcript_18535/g.64843  ORF Transcript_18535/g.64843 Transcript_18535/m.64843 type:complete len:263 (+) Transcript_18535:380-1168(+)
MCRDMDLSFGCVLFCLHETHGLADLHHDILLEEREDCTRLHIPKQLRLCDGRVQTETHSIAFQPPIQGRAEQDLRQLRVSIRSGQIPHHTLSVREVRPQHLLAAHRVQANVGPIVRLGRHVHDPAGGALFDSVDKQGRQQKGRQVVDLEALLEAVLRSSHLAGAQGGRVVNQYVDGALVLRSESPNGVQGVQVHLHHHCAGCPGVHLGQPLCQSLATLHIPHRQHQARIPSCQLLCMPRAEASRGPSDNEGPSAEVHGDDFP